MLQAAQIKNKTKTYFTKKYFSITFYNIKNVILLVIVYFDYLF